MAKAVDLKLVIKHLSNGNLGENLCIICLGHLNDKYENIFTKVCKEEHDFCVADVLENLCQIKFKQEDNYNVCFDCFTMAYMAYKFCTLSHHSNEILNFYSDELTQNLNYINVPEEQTNNTLCFTLPTVTKVPPLFDIQGIGKGNVKEKVLPKHRANGAKEHVITEDDRIVMVVQDNQDSLFYRVQEDGTLIMLDAKEKKNYQKTLSISASPKDVKSKTRKKRLPMSHKLCSRCPVKYRFAAKLKEHMKLEHNIDLFICKICKATTEDEHEYHNHMRTHTNVHQCDICHMVCKKRDTIINHLKGHEKIKNISQVEGAHICEICGVITEDETSLQEHYDSKHYKKYTCFYCGRLYKGEISFEMHIKKHEAHQQSIMQNVEPQTKKEKVASAKKSTEPDGKQKIMCCTCGRYFVDERALLWHQRLHNNERPFKCDVCDRSFVSVNRRNQHALCAHTAPTRRCPLCPALFHLRSMVNTHIRKVHLTTHKRRNRVSKHQNVFWRTEPVPLQDLSIDIQNDILEMQTSTQETSTSAQMMDMDEL